MIDLKRLLSSFKYAGKGIVSAFKKEQNLRIHILAAILAILLGIAFNFTRLEFAIVILVIAMVIVAELFNTAIEKLVDLVTDEHLPLAGLIKDIAAGAVLVAALASLGVGVFLYGGPMIALVRRIAG